MHFKLQISILICSTFLSWGLTDIAGQPNDYHPSPLPCVLLNQSPNIFVGQVVDFKTDDGNTENGKSLLTRFLVRESFIGSPQQGTVIIRISEYTADEIGIAPGNIFLVYAYNKQTNESFANIAPFTKLVEKAVGELAFLRSLRDKQPEGWIFGNVGQISKSSLQKNSRQSVPFAIVRVQGKADNKTFETTADADGNYSVEGLSPDWYEVGMKLPENSNHVAEGRQENIKGFGCAKLDVDIKAANKLSGRVIDSFGKPVSNVQLELIPFDYIRPKFDIRDAEERIVTESDGNFTILNVPPGKYVLAVNHNILPEIESPYPTSFYPGTSIRNKAQIIEIKAGKEIDGIEFVLGPERLIEKNITGRIVFPDGRPAANTDVYLKEDENEVCCVLKNVKTDAEGYFTLVGFATRKYRVWTFVDHKPFTNKINFIGASPVFVLDNRTRTFQIVLRQTTKYSLDAIDDIEKRERGIIK